MPRMEFPAPFSVVTNKDTGEVFILLSEKEINESYALRLADFETELVARGNMKEPPEALERARKAFAARLDAEKQREINDQKKVSGLANRETYTLVKPDYGILTECRAEVLTLYGGQWSESDFRYKVLCRQSVQKDGRTLSGDEIDQLDPTIADALGICLARTWNIDRRRLPFSLPQ